MYYVYARVQFVVSSGVLAFLLGRRNKATWVVAAGLAQVSEFSFVLSSRARRLKLLSREVRSLTAASVLLCILNHSICRRICSY